MFISLLISGRPATPTKNSWPATKLNTRRSTLLARASLPRSAALELTRWWLHDSRPVFHWRESVLARKSGVARFPEPHGHKSVGLQIGLQKVSPRAGNSQHCFRGEVSTAHCAFHGCGPAGGGPISGEKQSANAGSLFRPPAIHSGLRRKCCGGFFDHRG